MVIKLESVSKRFGKLSALDEVSLTIDAGQIVSVIGPNGAGKTTLLNALAGLISLSEGSLYYDDKVFRRGNMELRRRYCFLPDFPAFFEDWTVVRHVGMMLRVYEKETYDAESRLINLLKEFDLLPLFNRPLATLSRGQRYKAALIGLLMADPELWLLDEPFASGMDPLGINAFKRHCQSAVSRNRTVIYTTQLLDVAERFSDRACIIHQGKVRAFDSPSKISESAGENGGLGEIFEQLKEETQSETR